MSAPGANAGDVTVSFAAAFAGRLTSASCAAPTSVAAGGCWAPALVPASRNARAAVPMPTLMTLSGCRTAENLHPLAEASCDSCDDFNFVTQSKPDAAICQRWFRVG